MTAQKRRKTSKNRKKKQGVSFTKLLPYIIAVLVVVFLLYRIVVLIGFKVDCSDIPTGTLSENSAIVNTLFVFEQEEKIVNMEVVTYSKDQKKVLRMEIPTSVYVTEEGIDSFPISSTKSVGEFLDHGSGKRYTTEYIGDLLGLKFDNYVWLVNSSTKTDEFLSKLSIWSILFDFGYNKELKDNLYSNLPILNLIKEVNFLNQVLANYQYESMDILECCIEQVVVSGDRKEARFNKREFDQEFSKYISQLVSREVERERVNVEVYNASNITGLASEYARKVRHTGSRILRFDNSPNIYEKTIIFVPEPQGYSNSLALIRDLVGYGVEVRYERPSFITTGDIVLILGTDISN
jgi:hypothetical protein